MKSNKITAPSNILFKSNKKLKINEKIICHLCGKRHQWKSKAIVLSKLGIKYSKKNGSGICCNSSFIQLTKKYENVNSEIENHSYINFKNICNCESFESCNCSNFLPHTSLCKGIIIHPNFNLNKIILKQLDKTRQDKKWEDDCKKSIQLLRINYKTWLSKSCTKKLEEKNKRCGECTKIYHELAKFASKTINWKKSKCIYKKNDQLKLITVLKENNKKQIQNIKQLKNSNREKEKKIENLELKWKTWINKNNFNEKQEEFIEASQLALKSKMERIATLLTHFPMLYQVNILITTMP
jgi:hypothetical protein